jgi:hypothetical protein
LVEAFIAAVVVGLVLAMSVAAMVSNLRATRRGSRQLEYISSARSAQQQICSYIYQGRSVEVYSNRVDIAQTNNTVARLQYLDGDEDPTTVEDNTLVFNGDVVSGGEQVSICTHVSPLADEPMFSFLPLSPTAVRFAFHIGDGTHAGAAGTGHGMGHQGVEVRFSAAPRNLLKWYDQ